MSEYRWDVFISHASEDKDAVARPLAERLEKKGVRVWLDANELTLGDILHRKIDHGLAESRYGVVILSPAFFSKDWPQNELNGLFALESGRKVILPVWHGVDKDFVARYSPLLAGRLGIATSLGLDAVSEAVLRAIHGPAAAALHSPPAPQSRRKALIGVAAALLLAVIAVATWMIVYGRNSDKFGKVNSPEAQSAATASFRGQARAAGYSDAEVLESWAGDFLFDHWISPEVIAGLVARKSSSLERGDLFIGIWGNPPAKDSVWRVSTGLTRPGVRPALSSVATVVKAMSIEPRTGPARENAAGLSVAGWSLVIGAYAHSFPAGAGWICSNFAPEGSPLIDTRPKSDEVEQLSVQPAANCPPLRFLAVRKPGSEAPEERFRASILNLPAADSGKEPAETIFVLVSRENDPHPLPIRVSLLWLKRK